MSNQQIDFEVENKQQSNSSTTFFGTMITPSIISIVWVLGAIALSASLFFNLATSFRNWIFLAIVGNLIWRIVCEHIIVIFGIHRSLRSIEKKL